MTAVVPRMTRPAEGRLIAGVCQGVAAQLRLDPVVVRIAFVLLTIGSGLGVVAYVALWIFVPRQPYEGEEPPRDMGQLLAYGALTISLSMLIVLTGAAGGLVAWPIAIGGIGGLILWQQADPDQRQRWMSSTVRRVRQAWLRILLGLLLVVGGGIGFLAAQGQLAQARPGLLFTVVVVGGLAVITAPWLAGLVKELRRERRERIRQEERAEVAAHVHDSVLHTLTMIQRSASDPREVQRLARAQERELRNWLYRPKTEGTLGEAVRAMAAEVEDDHGVPIEVVCVGDCRIDERLGAAVQAAREAMVNAAKYSQAATIDVYAEVEPSTATIFVRDRGAGFDLDDMPEDRMGVRGSIIGRMERNGGTARIRTAPGEGTEVMLQMALETS